MSSNSTLSKLLECARTQPAPHSPVQSARPNQPAPISPLQSARPDPPAPLTSSCQSHLAHHTSVSCPNHRAHTSPRLRFRSASPAPVLLNLGPCCLWVSTVLLWVSAAVCLLGSSPGSLIGCHCWEPRVPLLGASVCLCCRCVPTKTYAGDCLGELLLCRVPTWVSAATLLSFAFVRLYNSR